MKSWKLWFIFLVFFLISGSLELFASVFIKLNKEVSIKGDQILLSDLGDIEGSSVLKDLFIAKSPRAGSTISLSGGRLRYLILEKEPEAKYEIPSIVRVRRESQAFSEDRILELISSYMLENLKDAEAEIKDLRILTQNSFPLGKLDYSDLSIFSSAKALRGSLSVLHKGKKEGTLRFSAVINRKARVVVAASDIAQGAIIKKEDLILKKRDLDSLPYGFSQDLFSFVGMEASQPLAADKVISKSSLKKALIVKRGDIVKLVLEDKNISLKLMAKALRDGGYGDRILVQNLDTGKKLQAEVSAPGRVFIGY